MIYKYSGILSALLITANSWAATQTFAAPQAFAIQAFVATASGTGTISSTGGGVIEVTGSGSSYTLQFPSSPSAQWEYILANRASVTITLSGNGKNIDGSATQSFLASQTANVMYDGTLWISLGLSNWNALSQAGVTTLTGTLIVNNKMVRIAQSFSGNGTIAAGSGSYVQLVANGGTVNLPTTSLTTGMELVIADESGNAATNNWVISGNGNNVNGAASLTINTNYKRITLRWSGSAWFGG